MGIVFSFWAHNFHYEWNNPEVPDPPQQPTCPTPNWLLVSGNKAQQGVCFTWSLRDLDWWRSQHLLATHRRKYYLITTARMTPLEGPRPRMKYCTLGMKASFSFLAHWSELLTQSAQPQSGWETESSGLSGNDCLISPWDLSFSKLSTHN